MPGTDFEVKRRELVVFYVLDTSGSMNDDGKISILNEAMRETTEVLRGVAKTNANAEVKIAVLEFNTGARWITDNGPVYLEDFVWEDLHAEGLTDIGMALNELDDKLSRHKYLKSSTGQFLPIIIFMSDGCPTDHWKKSLLKMKGTNKWFKYATKIAFGLGDTADEEVLAQIVGNSEAVVKTNNMELFKKLIRFVSATASMLVSKSKTSDPVVEGSRMVAEGMQEIMGVQPEPSAPVLSKEESLSLSKPEIPEDIWDDDDEWN